MSINPISALSDNIRIDRSKCVGCGECVERCTLDNLRLEQAPCSHACPLGINAQGYVQMLVRGNIEKAARCITDRTPFIGLLSSICTHPCEEECSRIKVDGKAVAIRALKRYLFEHTLPEPDLTVAPRCPGSCAVIGGGPAGLSAAWHLAKAGCRVTIFEAGDVLGGIPAQAIPAFRLPADIWQKECDLLRRIGAEIKTNTKIGRDLPFSELVEKYDTVFIAAGAPDPVRLTETPAQVSNVYYAMDYLTSAHSGHSTPAAAESVLVIGGGDMAIDAALTAWRNGAEEITVLSRGPLRACSESLAEAAAAPIRFDRGWGIASVHVQNGTFTGITAKQCIKQTEPDGSITNIYNESVTKEFSADQLILAVGQKTELSFLEHSSVNICGERVSVDPISLQTSVPHVYAGGDIIPGPNTVVHALADGIRAAESVLLDLNGDDLTYGRDNSIACRHEPSVDLNKGSDAARIELSSVNGERLERSMTSDEAEIEASRCLNCGYPVGQRRTCWLCMPCEVQCPENALEVGIPYSMA